MDFFNAFNGVIYLSTALWRAAILVCIICKTPRSRNTSFPCSERAALHALRKSLRCGKGSPRWTAAETARAFNSIRLALLTTRIVSKQLHRKRIFYITICDQKCLCQSNVHAYKSGSWLTSHDIQAKTTNALKLELHAVIIMIAIFDRFVCWFKVGIILHSNVSVI